MVSRGKKTDVPVREYHHGVPSIATGITGEDGGSRGLIENHIFAVADLVWPADLMALELIDGLEYEGMIENKELDWIEDLIEERV